jgi:hypothetical protein
MELYPTIGAYNFSENQNMKAGHYLADYKIVICHPHLLCLALTAFDHFDVLYVPCDDFTRVNTGAKSLF